MVVRRQKANGDQAALDRCQSALLRAHAHVRLHRVRAEATGLRAVPTYNFTGTLATARRWRAQPWRLHGAPRPPRPLPPPHSNAPRRYERGGASWHNGWPAAEPPGHRTEATGAPPPTRRPAPTGQENSEAAAHSPERPLPRRAPAAGARARSGYRRQHVGRRPRARLCTRQSRVARWPAGRSDRQTHRQPAATATARLVHRARCPKRPRIPPTLPHAPSRPVARGPVPPCRTTRHLKPPRVLGPIATVTGTAISVVVGGGGGGSGCPHLVAH